MSSTQGRCLIASPHLVESNFYRTVILMIVHSDEGAMGLVLNRPTGTDLKTVLESATKETCVHKDFLYRGGPVSGPLMALHNIASLSEGECVPSVHFTSNGRHFRHLTKLDDIRLRVFDGYAGWGPEQLESEMENGGWILSDINVDDVFSAPEGLWERMVHRVGRDILSKSIGKDRMPPGPNLN